MTMIRETLNAALAAAEPTIGYVRLGYGNVDDGWAYNVDVMGERPENHANILRVLARAWSAFTTVLVDEDGQFYFGRGHNLLYFRSFMGAAALFAAGNMTAEPHAYQDKQGFYLIEASSGNRIALHQATEEDFKLVSADGTLALQVSRGGKPWKTIARDKDENVLKSLERKDRIASVEKLQTAVMGPMDTGDEADLDLFALRYRIIPSSQDQ